MVRVETDCLLKLLIHDFDLLVLLSLLLSRFVSVYFLFCCFWLKWVRKYCEPAKEAKFKKVVSLTGAFICWHAIVCVYRLFPKVNSCEFFSE